MPEFDISIAGEINLDLIFSGLHASMPTERELLATDFTLTLGSSCAILAHAEAFRDPSLWKPFLKKHEFPGLA
jgi:hypothetical protein